MKKIFLAIVASAFCAVTLLADCPTPSTATATVTLTRRTGQFTVNASGDKVSFSPGNLQYQASTNTWRFAPQQYSYVGNAVGNTNPTSSQSGWIDLFGWGTSGWNNTAVDATSVHYQPWSTEKTDNGSSQSPQWDNRYEYGPGKSTVAINDSWSKTSNYDWGVYNAAQLGSGWRTLTKNEWEYLVNTRSASTVNGTANARYAKATVNSATGIILFPDSYTHPGSVTAPTNINVVNAALNSNIYSADQWRLMEAAGAVFLPCAGKRDETTISDVSIGGRYWSSTCAGWDAVAYCFLVSASYANPDNYDYRYLGFSVRLVQDL